MILAPALLATAVYTCAMERVDSMDPVNSQSAYDSRAVQLVYETPLEIDYEARPYRLVPGLCELPEVSADGLVYDLKMTAGAPLGAADVKRAIDRLRDPDRPSPGSWTMKRVREVTCPGDRSVRIVLDARQHVFPWMLAMAYCGVMAPDGGGTGPYRLKSWWRNHEMVFERNAGWRGWAAAADSPGLAPFDEIRYIVVDDISTQWLMFLRGEIDFLGSISRDNWGAVMDAGGRINPKLAAAGIRLCGGEPAIEVRYIGMNMRDPVLGPNRKLRQALSCAFDFPTWKCFYNNSIEQANGPVPPMVDGYADEPVRYGYDLERAKALLAEAGYPGGIDPATGRRLEVALSIGRPSQDSREAGELVASFYAKIGVKLELRFQTWEAFLSSVNRGDAQLFLMAWVGDYPDAENFLQLFHSKNKSPGPNHSDYDNPEYDAEYDAAMAAMTQEARRAHWRRCQEILREDCPWIFTHITKNYSLAGRRVLGFIPSDFPYGNEKYLRTAR